MILFPHPGADPVGPGFCVIRVKLTVIFMHFTS